MTARGPVSGLRRTVARRLAEDEVRVAGHGLPMVVRPARDGVSLAEYARTYPDVVRGWTHRRGAVLFRDFDMSLDAFGPTARALAGEPEAYLERSSPRTEVADRVYTATDHPADQAIPLHNENSYQGRFPATLTFCCLAPARAGGATPLADTRRVLARIPPDVLAPFAAHGVTYVRNFGGGLGLSWPEVFQTTSRDEVTRFCRARGIDVHWKRDGGLRTRQVRPAVAVHPVTRERVWFNHAVFFHPLSLPPGVREALTRQVAEEDLPSVTYYGDGRPIPPEAVRALAAAYAAEEVAVPWAAGDVLLVDNLLAAHGRQPFSGQRRVVVSMSAPVGWDHVDARRVGAA